MNPTPATTSPSRPSGLTLAIVGAGPVGLGLALHAARSLPQASITLFDTRDAAKDVSGDPRTLALSLGSVQILERLGAWRPELAQPILEVHVSQQPPSGLPELPFLSARFGEPALRIRAIDEAVPLLGAVLSYGSIVAPLQQAWLVVDASGQHKFLVGFSNFKNATTSSPGTVVMHFKPVSG